MIIVGVQSCAVGVGSSILGDKNTSGAGAMGLLVAFLFLIGGAFAFAKPIVSTVVFLLGCLAAIIAASGSSFTDMWIWAGVSFVLAIMSYFAHRGDKKKQKTHATGAGA
ncbi:MAG: hypothetical protein K6T68_13085, partial [Alicyclobacillus shizuokensis]|nr:hypothetical protein [Alicyclobacillus shizuokensis]